MKRYLAHLLADLETAVRHAPEPSSYAFRSPFRDDDDDTRTDGLHVRYVRLCDLFGLQSDAFPPVERLTKAQVTDVLNTLEKLWRAWHITWNCPSRLTARPRYTLMVEWMYRETVSYHPDFGAEIDFCKTWRRGKNFTGSRCKRSPAHPSKSSTIGCGQANRANSIGTWMKNRRLGESSQLTMTRWLGFISTAPI